MVNAANSFITSITNLSNEETSKELAEFCRRWLDDAAEKLSVADLDRILAGLAPPKFSAGYVCALAARLPKVRDESAFIEFATRVDDAVLQLNDLQILWIQDIYSRFFNSLSDEFMKRKLSIYGLRIMANAILKLTCGSTTLLTNIHSALFCLSLEARRFDVAAPFFQLDVIENFLSAPSMTWSLASEMLHADTPTTSTSSAANIENNQDGSSDALTSPALAPPLPATILPTERNVRKINLETRHVLSYFYYGATILCTLERWDEALRMLEHCICVPGMRLSAIVVEALKKYIIVSLLLGRYKPMKELPNYKSTVIQRQCVQLCTVYTRLAELVQKHSEQRRDVANVIHMYLESKTEVFRQDNHYGLLKQLVDAAKESAIKRLGTVFISLHLNEVSRLAHLPTEETEEIVRRLRHKTDCNVKIDQKTQTFRFDLESTGSEPSAAAGDINEHEIESAIREVIALNGLVSEFDAAVRLHPLYIVKSAKCMNFGSALTATTVGYQEDEGFQITGSPPIS